MKIAIFSDNFYPELSGISDSILTLGKELAKNNHMVDYYVPFYSNKNYRQANVLNQELDLGNNIKINRLFSFSFPTSTGQARMVIPLISTLKNIRNFKPDIIHSQLFFGAGLDALLASRWPKIPFVGTNHTAISEFVRYSPIKSEWFKNLSLRYVSWYYNACDFVTAPSQFVFDEMVQHGFHKPHQVLSNPIDTEEFTPVTPEKKAELKMEFNLPKHVIFYAGRIAAEKNIDIIIKALAVAQKQIPDLKLVIAGQGAAMESLKKLAKELQIENNVIFLGLLNKSALVRYYQSSDVFVITSTSETQSLVLMQGMASGIPAIGVRARALPEYINDQNGLLVEPGDFKTLAEKIVFLINNPDKLELLGRGALDFVQKFSTPHIAQEWISVYNKTMSLSKTRSK